MKNFACDMVARASVAADKEAKLASTRAASLVSRAKRIKDEAAKDDKAKAREAKANEEANKAVKAARIANMAAASLIAKRCSVLAANGITSKE